MPAVVLLGETAGGKESSLAVWAAIRPEPIAM